MTLNFSPCPIFPSPNPSEGEFVSSFWEKGNEGFGRSRRYNWDANELFDYGRDRGGTDRNGEPIYGDIVDLLPSDPFGMDLSTTWTAAIAGWIEDLGTEFHGDYGKDNHRDHQYVTGLNYLCDRATWFPLDPRLNSAGATDGYVEKELPELLGHASQGTGCTSVLDAHDQFGRTGEAIAVGLRAESSGDHGKESCSGGDERPPHEGVLFSLGYLGVQDLLSAERVCKSFHYAIQNDPLLWRCIHIDQPLSEKITDDALLQLTQRAQGSLECLSLVECSRITDDGLKRVLESNPRLTKLSVPGCARISIEGLVNNLNLFKSPGMPGIKHLRIGGRYGVTQEHFEELKLLLGADKLQQPKARKLRFYHSGLSSISCEDQCAIDIEMCPKCQNLRLVYDCPVESCQGNGSELCRACTFCIARCVQCGRCINDSEYEETFFLDLLCSGCWKHLIPCQEKQEEKRSGSDKFTPFSGRPGIAVANIAG